MPSVLPHRHVSALRSLLTSEASGGLVLMASAAIALALANSPGAPAYDHLLHARVLGLSIQHWVNDALMAVFFMLVGLEIKREFLDGRLAKRSQQLLPGLAALGGMLAPALIYLAVNARSPETLRGWAIPAATDIAFSLGVLALLGARVPVSLKVFLTALAVLDDLGAVVIIAVFYTSGLSPLMLALAAATFVVMLVLNRTGVVALWPYLGLTVALWVFVFFSGVHATVAGVLAALAIPLRASPGRPDDDTSPLHRLEHALQPWVAYAIMPIFGFANAGVALAVDASALAHPVTMGAALGLFVGKQAGVFAAVWLVVRLGLAHKFAGVSWLQIYGLALLCGIGFTMSLFIGGLAFASPELEDATKLGVLCGSVVSAICGWLVLRFAPAAKQSGPSHG